MNVSLSAPYDRRVGRHVLFRNNQVGHLIVLSFYHPFRYCGTQPGQILLDPITLRCDYSFQVQVCLTAKANKLTEEVRFLQNAAFGYVLFPLIPLDSPFCDIDKNTCTNMQPACGSKKPGVALSPGDEFCSCSNIAVPSAALPGVSFRE